MTHHVSENHGTFLLDSTFFFKGLMSIGSFLILSMNKEYEHNVSETLKTNGYQIEKDFL